MKKLQLFCLVLFAFLLQEIAVGESAKQEPYQYGVSLISKGDFDAAIEFFTKAIRAAPTDANLYLGRGHAYFGRSRQVKATPISASRDGLRKDKDYESALSDYSVAIRLNLSLAQAYTSRGILFDVNGERDKAIADYTVAIRINPADAVARYDRAVAYAISLDNAHAIADFSEVIRRDTKFGAAYVSRGRVYVQAGDYSKAVADFSEAIRLEPKRETLSYGYRGAAYAQSGEFGKAVDDFNEAIRRDPTDPAMFSNRGIALAGLGRADKALNDFDAAIRLCPNRAYYYEKRAAIRISRGDYDGGVADLNFAVQLDPGDPAAKFRTAADQRISEAATQHGKEQVRLMLRDRPAMAIYGESAAILTQYAARKFAGEDAHEEVSWDPSEPEVTECDSRFGDAKRARIRLRRTYANGPNRGEDQSFEALWSEVVHELANVAYSQDFARLDQCVDAGGIAKEPYVAKFVECESRSAEQVRAFYIRVFLPWSREQRMPTDPNLWYIARRVRPNDNLLLANVNKQGYYWRYYENRYDEIVLRRLLGNGENDKVIELATEFQSRVLTREEKADVCLDLGLALRGKGELDKAVAKLSEAIAIGTGSSWAYVNRGSIFASKGEYDKAIADYDGAIRLDREDSYAFYCRALAYENGKRDLDSAIADYSEAVRLNPQNVDAFYLRGETYIRRGEYDKAIADETAAIRLRPNFEQPYRQRAFAYQKKGDQRSADLDSAAASKIRRENVPKNVPKGHH